MCKCGRIPPYYSSKKFRIHEELEKIKAGDETHDMVYELNMQMCDLEIDRERWDKIGKEWDSKKKEIVLSILKGNDMEKKKMTKAEAFEYLKGKKVLCYSSKMEAVQGFVKSLGFHWSDYSQEPMLVSILFLGEDGRLTYSVSLKRFEEHEYEEISADDILSIEIVEGTPKFSYEKVVELAKPLMEYLNDTGWREQIGVSCDHIVAQPMATFLHGEMKGC